MDEIIDRAIVIDSCVLIYFFENMDGGKTKELIGNLQKNNNRIFISDISAFEVFKNRQDGEKIKEYEGLLNSIDGIPVDRPVLMNASTLYYLYKRNKNINKKEGAIDPKDRLTGDLIIGGTVISYENYLLLTANKKDFPSPFWDVITTFEIGENPIKVYLLQPSMKSITSEIPLIDPKNWKKRERTHFYRG